MRMLKKYGNSLEFELAFVILLLTINCDQIIHQSINQSIGFILLNMWINLLLLHLLLLPPPSFSCPPSPRTWKCWALTKPQKSHNWCNISYNQIFKGRQMDMMADESSYSMQYRLIYKKNLLLRFKVTLLDNLPCQVNDARVGRPPAEAGAKSICQKNCVNTLVNTCVCHVLWRESLIQEVWLNSVEAVVLNRVYHQTSKSNFSFPGCSQLIQKNQWIIDNG